MRFRSKCLALCNEQRSERLESPRQGGGMESGGAAGVGQGHRKRVRTRQAGKRLVQVGVARERHRPGKPA